MANDTGASPNSISLNNEVKDYADTTREMIRHEDELVNQRLTWLGTFEGFLFVAYSFAKTGAPKITWLVCLLGVLVAASVLVSTFLGAKATGKLVGKWDKYKERIAMVEWEPDVQGISGNPA